MASIFEGNESVLPDNWVDVPSFYIDGALGAAHARGLHKVLLGAVTFNTDKMATDPTFKPVCELVLTNEAVRDLIEYLQNLPGVVDEDA